jgi:acetyltransferase-like isoleucine patch superfamily enzyme
MNESDYKIHAHVRLGEAFEIGAYVIIGLPLTNKSDPQETVIGDFAVIRSHTIIYAGNKIGNNFKTGHNVLIRENNTIGNNVSIGSSTVVEHHVQIGNGVRIHSQAFIPEFTVLEEGCWIGPNVVFTNARYPNQPDTKANLQGVTVGAGAIIGANVTILPGITIGANALIGAGSVVTKNVPPRVVSFGNPANTVREL